MKLPFIGPSYDLPTRPSGVQRTVNMFPIPVETGNQNTRWEFKDAPGLEAWSLPVDPLEGFIYLDTFTGAAETLLVDHEPDVAPVGFAYEVVSANGLKLVGDGTARSENTGDGLNDSDASSPPLSQVLTAPYRMQLTATHSSFDSEQASFRIEDVGNSHFMQIGAIYTGGFYRIRVSWNLPGYPTANVDYIVSGPDIEYAVDVVFGPTSFATSIDGVPSIPFGGSGIDQPLVPLALMTRLQVQADGQISVYTYLSRAGLKMPA